MPKADLHRTIPALPVRDMGAAVASYRERFASTRDTNDGFSVLVRDDPILHLWVVSDESWRSREDLSHQPKRPAQPPPASASITATDYAFDAKNLAAGRSTVELHDAGREQHHFVLAPILKAKTFADVKKFATSEEESGAPPVDFENQIISGVIDGGEKQSCL